MSSQLHLLHGASADSIAATLASCLESEGYRTTWDGQDGALAAMSGKTLERAHSAVCVPIWTREIRSAKWTREAVEHAYQRRALIEIALHPLDSAIEGGPAPLDFSPWNGETNTLLWKSFMGRVRETAGHPTGRLPLKEEAKPALYVMIIGFAAIAGMLAGGVPSGRVAQSDALALLNARTAPTGAATSVGGPVAGVHEPASAAKYSLSAKVEARFERMEPAPKVTVVPILDFNAQTSELASAGADATAPEHPVL